jgi:glycosyltransferase involved in cell wall biosynthesis
MILFEAMSAGCAIVATNRGGVPEIIQHKINGLLVNPFDANDIIQKIHHLISDDNILVQLSEASIRYVLDKNNSSFEKEIENIYSVLANNS